MFVADTNILASFAAARELKLLLKALSVERIFISPAVRHEIEMGLHHGARHLQEIMDRVETGAIRVLDLEPEDQERMTTLPFGFGAGEREGVALCSLYDATLLSNDSQVRRYCKQHGIACLDLTRLLRLLWLKNVATQAHVKTMIVRMEKVEHLVLKEPERIFAPHVK